MSPWLPLESAIDGRHYLDGEPVHCGDVLEMAAVGDGRGSYVRYEISWPADGRSIGERAVLCAGPERGDACLHIDREMRFRWPQGDW